MTRFILKKKSTGLYYRNKGLNGRWIDDISKAQLFVSESKAMNCGASVPFWYTKEYELDPDATMSWRSLRKEVRRLYGEEFKGWFNDNFTIIPVELNIGDNN